MALEKVSRRRFLVRTALPTLVVTAKDDPLVPFSVYAHPAFRENPWLSLVAAEHGGHLGFISRRRPRFWLDGVVLEWLEQTIRSNKTAAGLVS